jgi:RNA polymerase sigma-70 factor (ECF subfamily)
MNTISASLLDRLRQTAAQGDWDRFVHLYTPLLFYWSRHTLHLQEQDAADLVQDVFTALVQRLPGFVYDRDGSFRSWLRTVLLNTWRNQQRRHALPVDGAPLSDLPGVNNIARFEEEEQQRYLVARALEMIQARFEPSTWKAFWETWVCDRPIKAVAAELGVKVNAVYVARSKVLSLLRHEFGPLLD